MTAPRWFDSRLSIGNILTIAAVIVGLVAGWYQFDNRLNLTEDRFARQVAADDAERRRVETRMERMEGERDDMRTRVIRIEEQLKGQDTKLDIILRRVSRDDGRN
jgi:hypothetical protein